MEDMNLHNQSFFPSKMELSAKKNGVSGLMRVKDDEEFIEQSIDSCIEALDELVIVYNGCTDRSPEIIKKKALQYKGKIKYYEYKPIVYANNLSKEEYEFIKAQPSDSPHLLANYYNFGLSKVSYKYVMKIDADQVYFTERLIEVCNAYRATKKVFIGFIEFCCFVYFYVALQLFKRTSIDVLFKKRAVFQRYKKCLLKLITNYKIPVFLSGYNLLYNNGVWYSSLGKFIPDSVNVLPPYNGVSDHMIFRITEKTYFIPFEQSQYTQLNSYKYSVIELFKGVRFSFPYGFMWFHLNACRKRIYEHQVVNLKKNREAFIPIGKFLDTPFNQLNCTDDMRILPRQSRCLYRYLHDSNIREDGEYIVNFISQYYINQRNFVLLKEI